MPYNRVTLPEYPVTEDIWDEIARQSRPVVVYGMGNGADKLFERLNKIGVTPTDIFASDGFVRGHSFRGMRVKSFSEIKETYSDFVILLSFASNRTEVLEMLTDIDKKYDLYIPDMPVADAAEYFDKEFYNSHYAEILDAYSSLADEDSRSAFASVVRYKLSGRMSYLEGCYSTLDELYALLPCARMRSVIDVGAYNGDTLKEMRNYFPSLSRATLIEPDPKTYRRLLKYTDTVTDIELTTINAAAWCESGEGAFTGSANRNSSISSTASYESRVTEIPLIRVDDLGDSADYIKYDVEGAEREALIGTKDTIIRHAPALLISLYHRSRDIFALVLYMKRVHPEYKLYLRRLRCVPAWEIDLIATT